MKMTVAEYDMLGRLFQSDHMDIPAVFLTDCCGATLQFPVEIVADGDQMAREDDTEMRRLYNRGLRWEVEQSGREVIPNEAHPLLNPEPVDTCGNCHQAWPCGCPDPAHICGICGGDDWTCTCDERSYGNEPDPTDDEILGIGRGVFRGRAWQD